MKFEIFVQEYELKNVFRMAVIIFYGLNVLTHYDQ